MRAINTALFSAILAAPGAATADRPPESPDFHQAHAVRGDVDRELAASEATNEMNPVDVLHFDRDSSRLDAVDLVQLRAAATWLARHPDHDLVIEGHTDPEGSAEYNRYLARLRAEAVRDALVDAGVPDSRLVLFAYGEHQPVSTDAAANRRVRIWAAP